MQNTPSTKSERQRHAIHWVLRLRADNMSEEEFNTLTNWLATDHENSAALDKAEQLFDEMAHVAQQNEQIETPAIATPAPLAQQQPALARPSSNLLSWFQPAVFASLIILIASFIVPQQSTLLQQFFSDYSTGTGEIEQHILADGSQIILDSNTALSIDYSDDQRKILLHQGRAHFTVNKDSRPFIVASESFVIKALGTVFQVYRKTVKQTRISVQLHAVAIQDTATGQAPLTLSSGYQLDATSNAPLAVPVAVDSAHNTAWQQRRLVINDQPLQVLLDELQRYRHGRVFIRDAHLRQQRISGVFSLDSPKQIIDDVSHALRLKQTRVGPWVLLSR